MSSADFIRIIPLLSRYQQASGIWVLVDNSRRPRRVVAGYPNSLAGFMDSLTTQARHNRAYTLQRDVLDSRF